MGGNLSHSQLYGLSLRFPQDQGQQGGTGGYRNARPPPLHGDTQLPALMGRPWQVPEYYEQVYEVTAALARAGLQSSNLILGIDFTKGNERTGTASFQGRSLHHISRVKNPYEEVISIIEQTLSRIGQDNLLPCFGFGDASTEDQDIFCFYHNETPCNGLSEALNRYRELTPNLQLAGPTSFAPIIEMAMTIVERSGRQYHVLLIIANAQVMRGVPWRREIDAIVRASKCPLSIVLVGVGDDPEGIMKNFADKIPTRDFDNFQFVNFSEIMFEDMPQASKDAAFALSALRNLPKQYEEIVELSLLGCRDPSPIPLPPPAAVGAYSQSERGFYNRDGTMSNNLPQSRKEAALMEEQNEAPDYDAYSDESKSSMVCLECGSRLGISSPEPNDNLESANTKTPDKVCTICTANTKEMVFGCGHQVCCVCCEQIPELCPFCRSTITNRIKLID